MDVERRGTAGSRHEREESGGPTVRQLALGSAAGEGPRQATLETDRTDDDGTDAEVVNAFAVDGTVLFRGYFEGEEAFAALEPYYDPHHYRFAVPADEFRSVAAAVAEFGYELRIADDPRPYAVALRKYTAHPEVVFEAAVLEAGTAEFNVFLLADEGAVEAATDGGALPIAEAPVDLRIPAASDRGPLSVRDVAGDRGSAGRGDR